MKSGCATCKLHAYADKKPDSFIARFWRWHTKWCPGWKAYQRELSERQKAEGQGTGQESDRSETPEG